jgi:hypothetical protein
MKISDILKYFKIYYGENEQLLNNGYQKLSTDKQIFIKYLLPIII